MALLAFIPVAPFVDLLTMGWLTTLVMLAVGFWEGRLVRIRREAASRRQQLEDLVHLGCYLVLRS